jgi:hypothetical protein
VSINSSRIQIFSITGGNGAALKDASSFMSGKAEMAVFDDRAQCTFPYMSPGSQKSAICSRHGVNIDTPKNPSMDFIHGKRQSGTSECDKAVLAIVRP